MILRRMKNLHEKKVLIEQLIEHMFHQKLWNPKQIDLILAVRSGHRATVARVIDALRRRKTGLLSKSRHSPELIFSVKNAFFTACKEDRSEVLHELLDQLAFQLLYACTNYNFGQEISKLTETNGSLTLFYKELDKKLIARMRRMLGSKANSGKTILKLFQIAVDIKSRAAIERFFEIIKQGSQSKVKKIIGNFQSNKKSLIKTLFLLILTKGAVEPDQEKQELYQLILKLLIECPV